MLLMTVRNGRKRLDCSFRRQSNEKPDMLMLLSLQHTGGHSCVMLHTCERPPQVICMIREVSHRPNFDHYAHARHLSLFGGTEAVVCMTDGSWCCLCAGENEEIREKLAAGLGAFAQHCSVEEVRQMLAGPVAAPSGQPGARMGAALIIANTAQFAPQR